MTVLGNHVSGGREIIDIIFLHIICPSPHQLPYRTVISQKDGRHGGWSMLTSYSQSVGQYFYQLNHWGVYKQKSYGIKHRRCFQTELFWIFTELDYFDCIQSNICLTVTCVYEGCLSLSYFLFTIILCLWIFDKAIALFCPHVVPWCLCWVETAGPIKGSF